MALHARRLLLYIKTQLLQGSAAWNDDWTGYYVSCQNLLSVTDRLIDHFNANGIPTEGMKANSVSCGFPLAWGEVVPIWFVRPMLCNTPVIVISLPQARFEPLESQPIAQSIGYHLSLFMETLDERSFLVVSGDLSHVHGCDAALLSIRN